MKNSLIVSGLILIFLMTACKTKPDVNEENVSNYMEGEKAKENWSQNTSAEQKEILNDFARSEKLVTTRKKVTLEVEKRDSILDPIFQEDMVAGVEIRMDKVIDTYSGEFKIESLSEQRIKGLLNDGSSVTIFYKLPNKSSLPQIGGTTDYLLDYSENLISGSMNKTILVKDKRSPFLLLLEEGNNEPYNRYFKSIDLSVKQLVDDPEKSAITIDFQNQSFVLSLGERKRVKSLSGEVEFFLKASSSQKNDNLLGEGMPYFIKLYVYRL